MRTLPWLLLLAACPGPEDTPTWDVVGEGLPSALLSIRGTSADDVWAVGGDVGDGPAVVHWDGASWDHIDTQTSGDLWWLHLDGDTVWMVGDGGRILSLDKADRTVVETVVDPEITLFGIWGGSDDVLWAVGGDVASATEGASLWRGEGGTWTSEEIPAEAAGELALYKVWGTAPDDVWICGTNGVLLHRDGTGWSAVASPTTRTLFTVHGDGSEAWAVGGYGNAAVAHLQGGTWADESPQLAPQLNGVYTRDGAVVAVGRQGAVWWRDAGVWAPDERGPATPVDLHGVWIDPDGGMWSVGGSIASSPLDQGVVIYEGEAAPGALTP